MRCVAPGKPAFDTGMSMVSLPVLMGRHTNDVVTPRLSNKRASHTALGTGSDRLPIWLTFFNDRFFNQGSSRTGLYTGPTRDAF